jgi:trans-aconitate methyltransferase
MLLEQGVRDVSVLDISHAALDASRHSSPTGVEAELLAIDVRAWEPHRQWTLWHDRAMFHFLTSDDDVDRYVATATRAVAPDGHAVIATFGPDGPTTCSGLATRSWSEAEVAARFAPAFDFVAAERRSHRTPAGHPQQFVYTVLRRGPAS